ncbi:flagellar filament capping protein FliD [Ewingella americana]|uniref:Flagellar hook-associated protein 2 n=1 Tax=Ewingella americana TaxID=41202 RepID=A0A502GUT1_9GAMM|nr:flagellar filament capping protein FliD [Ewingella americana]TPG64733.1 flagellar filament capping protein FliD [Ewingella americana]
MASVSSLGAGTTLDLSSLMDSLTTAENARMTPLTTQQTSYKAKLTSFSILQTALDKLKTTTVALQSADTISGTSVTSTNTSFTATLTAGTSAPAGSFKINVTQLAQAQSLLSGTVASATANVGTTGATGRTLTIAQAGKDPISVTLTDDQTTLNGVRDAINAKQGGVTASVIKANDNSYHLALTSNDSGTANAMTVSVTGDDTLNKLIGYDPTATTNGMSVSTIAQDAKFSVNGLELTRSTNTVTDALSGVTLNLNSQTSTTSGPETLSVTKDTTAMTKAIQNYVDAYNSLQTTIASQTAYTAVTKGTTQDASNGALFGDGTVRTISTQLRGQLGSSQPNADYSTLASMGITQDINGKLQVDNVKLGAALTNKPASVTQFFKGDGVTTGFATQSTTMLTKMLDSSNGTIQSAEDGINKSLKTLADQMTSTTTSINTNLANYKTQFTNLSVLVNKLTNTGNYLTQQFASTSSTS